MGVEHERAFEDEICAHLEANGWLYSSTDAGYDKQRALFPEDVLAWLEATQSDELAKVVKPSMSAAEQARARDQLLDRLVKTLDAPLDTGGGTLNVLRGGFKKTPARFSMCQFRPATTLNASALERYSAVRVRVVRQVHYSTKSANSSDLVLFVNGLPVATIELKTDNTQSIQDATTCGTCSTGTPRRWSSPRLASTPCATRKRSTRTSPNAATRSRRWSRSPGQSNSMTSPLPESSRYTDTNLNGGLRGRTLPVAFGTDDFQILIVANKYQTGFDQPLLSAMYVDKRLSGVTAVQTLSRLNRTYPAGGKDTTYVLDFVNDPEEILESFKPYYRQASLEDVTDPDIVHDLQAKLDAAGIYTDGEVEAFTTAYLSGKHGAISAPLKSAADRFNDQYAAALAAQDKTAAEQLDLFRKDVGSFVRLYDFLSQIINYQDTDLEKRSLFLRFLQRRLTGRTGADAVDFSTVELTHIKQARSGDHDLDLAGGEARHLQPVTATGTGAARDPRMVRLAEVLAKVNDLFAGEDFTPGEQQSWVEGIVTVLLDNETVTTQARANSVRQFVESPDLTDAVTDAVAGNQTSHNKMVDYFFTDERVKVQLVRLLGELVHENVKAIRR